MLISGLILAIFGYTLWSGLADTPGALMISVPAGVAAVVVFIAALVSYFVTPRTSLEANALAIYALSLAMIVLLIFESGMTSSPFIALWMLMVFFAPVFGRKGMIIVGMLGATYIIWQIVSEQFDFGMVSSLVLFIALPLGLGMLVWHHQQDKETEEDRSFSELASKLSSVSGQSEVVIAAISDGVLALNQKGEIKLINPAAQKIIGWGSEDALGLSYKSVLKLLDAQDKPVEDSIHPIEQALQQQKESSTDKLSILTADSNRKVLLSITASPVAAADSGVIVVFRDITKAKAEEREQAEFISTASHEMRTPVASIEGYLGLALNPATAQIDEKARDFITKAHLSAQHLGRLFQDLLDVSKADDGRLTSNPTVIDVVDFTHSVAESLLPQASSKNLRIEYKPRPDLYDDPDAKDERFLAPVYYTKADADHLREALNNLVENAIKYTLEGSIVIDVKGDDSSITISIADSGIGIPKEDIGHLFQKFYRVDNSDTREIGGTGLGLYLTRKLVESIGGSIWVESVYKQGSTFFIKVPRLDAVTARQEIEASAEKITEPAVTPINLPPATPPQPSPTLPPSIATAQPVQPAPTPQQNTTAQTPAPSAYYYPPFSNLPPQTPPQTNAQPQPQTPTPQVGYSAAAPAAPVATPPAPVPQMTPPSYPAPPAATYQAPAPAYSQNPQPPVNAPPLQTPQPATYQQPPTPPYQQPPS